MKLVKLLPTSRQKIRERKTRSLMSVGNDQNVVGTGIQAAVIIQWVDKDPKFPLSGSGATRTCTGSNLRRGGYIITVEYCCAHGKHNGLNKTRSLQNKNQENARTGGGLGGEAQ